MEGSEGLPVRAKDMRLLFEKLFKSSIDIV
jgi:hypothetical protein